MLDRPLRQAAAGLGLLATLATGAAQAADWSDTAIGYRYGTQFHEPGNPHQVAKHVLQVTHASGYSLGQHFLNLDLLQSDSADLVSGSSSGATEAYLIYRHQLHAGKLLASPIAFSTSAARRATTISGRPPRPSS